VLLSGRTSGLLSAQKRRKGGQDLIFDVSDGPHRLGRAGMRTY
jgi:hypothetical protein